MLLSSQGLLRCSNASNSERKDGAANLIQRPSAAAEALALPQPLPPMEPFEERVVYDVYERLLNALSEDLCGYIQCDLDRQKPSPEQSDKTRTRREHSKTSTAVSPCDRLFGLMKESEEKRRVLETEVMTMMVYLWMRAP